MGEVIKWNGTKHFYPTPSGLDPTRHNYLPLVMTPLSVSESVLIR